MNLGSTWAIETESLSRRYGRGKQALNGLTLRLPRGGIHAIVGANGAGKSTLFRILLGFLSPSSGSASVLGVDCQSLGPAERARIGFVNEEHSLPAWMGVQELIAMQRRLYAAQQRWDEKLLEEVLGYFNVERSQRVSELSRGERAGLSLALALAQQPELLILDEPTLGLDVVSKRAFLEALLFCGQQRGATIIYCSHQMEEIERVADQLIVLERGELRHQSTPDEFCQRVRLWQLEFPVRAPDLRGLPGYLESQTLDGLTELLLFDQDHEAVLPRLEQLGVRRHASAAVGLDRAVNAVLAQRHAAPRRTAAAAVQEALDA
ncbi:ABC transporter ATP-binding protein [Pelomonas sp. SE-A7]|uniref:ABC transporter ATP-binding protein n=1 Tax=Pelomonas sp. SE-A7 TaxID=3054953 RepID=UPI00259D1A96|nr:ABC transporter ATP-binding protein [Pelomonas sp. SE-A7]MDM4765494.1 ABC transporter ATP-binding protein [Pelomonas sp. SE-A7]